MADQNSTPNTGDNQPDPNTPATTDTTQVPADSTPVKTYTKEEVDKMVEKTRKDAEKKAKMSEDERKDAELAELKKTIRDRDTKDVVVAQATKLSAKNPTAVFKIIQSEITYNEKGEIENLNDLLKTCVKDFPELFGKTNGSADAGAGNQSNRNKSMNDWLRGK